MSQAFRHLYVLATEPRYVEAIDVYSRASVYVPLSVKMQQPAQVICMLPPGRSVETSAEVLSCMIPPLSQRYPIIRGGQTDVTNQRPGVVGMHLVHPEEAVVSCSQHCGCLDGILFAGPPSSSVNGSQSNQSF